MAQWIGVNATRLAWETKVETASQRLVLLAIAKYADQDGTAFPSVESLCADTCLNRKTAFKVLKELQEIGAIVVSKRQPNNGNCYSICGACPKNGSTEIGTTKNGTTNIGTAGSTKNGTSVVPKTVHEEEQEESKEEKQVSCALPDGSSAADFCPSVDEFGLTNEPAFVAEKPKKQTKKPKAVTHAFNLETLPEDWAVYCKEVRPDLDPARVFSAFKAYWTMGRGKGTLRADKSWFQSWANWVKKENEGRGRSQATEVNGLLPDQSRNPFYFPDGGRPNRKTTEVPRDYDATAEASDLVGRMLG